MLFVLSMCLFSLQYPLSREQLLLPRAYQTSAEGRRNDERKITYLPMPKFKFELECVDSSEVGCFGLLYLHPNSSLGDLNTLSSLGVKHSTVMFPVTRSSPSQYVEGLFSTETRSPTSWVQPSRDKPRRSPCRPQFWLGRGTHFFGV